MTKQYCQLCNRHIKGMMHIAFIPLKEVLYFPHVQGIHLRLCLECECGYLAQMFDSNLNDVDEYINWINLVEKK